ncbi:PilZ domain-containing protein [Hyphomicrobium sulfonivorans]|uniref:PilZ domain-containing protein n=1 Tax=Hyphomicrobium sulfonivorans TaxID=121290 RepID=UPI00156F59A8|nr:PilZ domain-containing protein [Hyphomicrobium sulfonivorans]MBI1650640.1 PilZ domain-containing protein [Hyphomicrobium sulfonivorans]NSL72001.1 pilus assembly protein PilZ [Hyphomicrobium sulfonivorans]
MSTGSEVIKQPEPENPGPTGRSQRRFPRFSVSLPGRFMRSDKLDYPCQLIDISVESAAMTTPIPLRVGEHLIVYLTRLGGLEGSVVRLFPGSFAMAISGTQRKRDKLAVQLPRLAAETEIPDGEVRTYPRVSANESALLVLEDGSSFVCPLHDLSMSGAAIVTPERPPLGSQVMLDKRAATVVRHHERGIAVKFHERFITAEFGSSFRSQSRR